MVGCSQSHDEWVQNVREHLPSDLEYTMFEGCDYVLVVEAVIPLDADGYRRRSAPLTHEMQLAGIAYGLIVSDADELRNEDRLRMYFTKYREPPKHAIAMLGPAARGESLNCPAVSIV
jgi:hypothetical protein